MMPHQTPDADTAQHWFGRATSDELCAFARQFARFPHEHGPDAIDPSTRQWRYVPALPVEDGCWPEEWRAWFLLEGETERYHDLIAHFDAAIAALPIIALEGERGGLYVWDGNHRLGIACLLGRTTIPAILGEKRV